MRYIIILFFALWIPSKAHSQQIIEDIGHGIQVGLPLSALTMTLIKKDKKGAYQLLKSFGTESLLVFGLKVGINRKRPNGKNYSFPSGHTAVSFMSSTFIWKRYGWEYGVPATVLAGFVGYSRAGTDEPVHFWSDVFAGAAIGILSSWVFTKKQGSDLKVDIKGNLSYVGINMKYQLY